MNSEYGTYRLTYTPPTSDGYTEYPLISIDMSTGGDANVNQMLRFYEAFLSAAGYILNGELQLVEESSVTLETDSKESINFNYVNDFWNEEDSVVGNPWAQTVGSGLPGGMWGADHLFINSADKDTYFFS